jgi:hypothetical protein
MSVFCRNLNLRRCTPLLATFVMILAAGGVLAPRAQAQQPPYALFERSTLTASGNTINAIQVPVVLASGITVYLNLSLQFLVDSTGNLTLASGYPQVTPSPILLTGSFVAGKYVTPGTSSTVNVAGPGVLDGGITQWTGVGTCGSTVTWYAGPIASNPYAARITKAGITSTAWSYGIGAVCNLSGSVSPDLIGVSQVGNTLTFVDFTLGGFGNNASTDANLPRGQIVYTLAP